MSRLLALLLSAALALPAGAAAPRVSVPQVRLGGAAVAPVSLPVLPTAMPAAPSLAPQPALNALPAALPAALPVPAAVAAPTLTLVAGRARDAAAAPAVAVLEQGAALAAERPSDVGRL